MADDNRALHVKPPQRLLQQGGLRIRCPDPAARPIAEAEAGPIEGDDPVIFAEQIEDPAQHEITGHCSVAVQQHDSGTGPALDVMEAHAVDRDEFALRRVPAFSPSRQGMIDQAHSRQHSRCPAENQT